jgi:hypothetical protein
LPSFFRGRIVALEAGGALQLLDHRVQRAGRMVGRAVIQRTDVWLALKPSAHFPHEPRLAYPGLAREQHHLPLAVPGLLPATQQQCDFLLAPDQRCQPARVTGLEAALGHTLARHPPDPEGLSEAFEALGFKVVQLEQGSD